MKKKRLTILALLMTALMLLSIGMLVACNKDDTTTDPTTETITATEGLLINNSDFKVVATSDVFPKSITDWSGAKMYSSGSYADQIIGGAVSLVPSSYESNRTKWNDNGGVVKDDKTLYDLLKSKYSTADGAINNLMMIYMPTEAEKTSSDDNYGPTAYGYTSKNFTLAKASYYKLTVDVLTYNIAGTDKEDNVPGARIYVSANTYVEFADIDTKGEWKTYTIYFESAANASTALSINLALGKYTSAYTKGLTTGYAFFGDLSLTKLETADGASPAKQYSDAVAAEKTDNSQLATTTLKVNNGRFDYGTTSISSSSAPNNWSVVTGNSSKSDPAPTSLGYNGIIDVTKFASNINSYSPTIYKDINGTLTQTSMSKMLETLHVEDVIKDFGENDTRIGNNVYMLSQQLMTAQGLKSSKSIVFEKNKIYELSISIYTFNIRGEGVSLILTGDGKDIVLKGISQNKSDTYPDGTDVENAGASNNGWQTYSFYIKGNEYRDMSYTMTLWLGTGGTNDNYGHTYTKYTSTSSSGVDAIAYSANGTFSTGWAFFDELNLAEMTETAYSAISGSGDAFDDSVYEASAADGTRLNKIYLHSDNLFKYDQITQSGISAGFAPNEATAPAGVSTGTLGTPGGFSVDIKDEASTPEYLSLVTAGVMDLSSNGDFSPYGIEHPLMPYVIDSTYGLMMYAKSNSFYSMRTDNFTIKANNFYRISLWVKTVDIKSTSGIYVTLFDKDDTSKASFSAINTADYDEYTNDWIELTFVIRGATKGETEMYLQFTLGTGTRWTSSTLAKGAAFVCNMSMTELTYTNYTDLSDSTYQKKVNLSTTHSNNFTNGSFDNFDIEKSALSADGELDNAPGVPSNWSLSDNTQSENPNFISGILTMDTDPDTGRDFSISTQIGNVFKNSALISEFQRSDFYTEDDYKNYAVGGPSMLAIGGINDSTAKAADAKKFAIGYTSDSFTLSAGTNYVIEVWVKAVGAGTFGCIYLDTESSGTNLFSENNYFTVQGSATAVWQKYTFNIQVGLTSVSAKLGLYLGYNTKIVEGVSGDAALSDGLILFDSVNRTSGMSDEDFDAIAQGDYSKKITYLADGFNSSSTDASTRKELTTPTGWTGGAGTNQDKANTKAGIVYSPKSGADLEEDEDSYLKIFGPSLSIDDFDYTTEELAEAMADPDNAGKNEDEVILIIKKAKLAEAKAARMITIKNLGTAFDGNSMLIINNIADSAYAYSSSSYSFTAETVYRVSVWARTYGIEEGKGAYIELYLGSADESDAPFRFDIVASDVWTQYTFYVKTLDDSVSSVQIKLGLGRYDADDATQLVSGYAMFDSVEIEIIDNGDKIFDDLKAEEEAGTLSEFIKLRKVAEKDDSGNVTPEPDPETPDTKFNLDNLWWMIPSIVLGLAIILVVAVFFFKRFRRPKKEAVVTETNKDNEGIIEEKHNKYDSFNE